jgi:cobalt-zinc-cadmium resistance protein CzcA
VIAAHRGVPIRVRDVARVVEGHEMRRGAVTADGKGEVVLGLGFMLMGENSRDVTRASRRRSTRCKKSLPPGSRRAGLRAAPSSSTEVLDTVRKNLLEGALLVIAVLFIFLGNLRAGLIVALGDPAVDALRLRTAMLASASPAA